MPKSMRREPAILFTLSNPSVVSLSLKSLASEVNEENQRNDPTKTPLTSATTSLWI